MNDLLNKCMLCLFFLCIFAGVGQAQSGQGKEMIFYPTDISKAGELSYLRDSIKLMLASRLSTAAGVQPVFEKGVSKGAKASYRVKSSLVQKKDSIELSAIVSFPSNDKQPLSFFATADDGTQIMEALDNLVSDMNKSLFDVPGKPTKTAAKNKNDVQGNVDFRTPHPERAYKENSGFGLSISQDEFIAQMGLEVQATERYKSAILPVKSQGMTAGDIDGDSHDEILIATNTRLLIYQLRDKQIKHLDTISLPGGLGVHALNVADLDKNGLMEIYISCTRDKEPRSMVLEWSPSTGVKRLHENVYWYLRPLVIPGEGVVLAGQKAGVGELMQSGIYRLAYQSEGKITGDERLDLPESVNLFDFVFADLDGDSLSEVVAIDRKERLLVYSSGLQLIYTSPAGFGGRELAKEYTAPIRLVVADFDNDGNHDILIVDNELYSPKILSKSRLYKNGQVRGLIWDGVGFIEMWHTNLFPNGVIDFQFLSSVETVETIASVKGRLFLVEPEKGDLLEGFILGAGGNRVSVFGMDFISKDTVSTE